VIVIQRASGNFKIYEERKPAPKSDSATVTHLAKGAASA